MQRAANRRMIPLCLLLVKYHATGTRFENTIVSGISTRAPQTAPSARRQSRCQKCGSKPFPSTCRSSGSFMHRPGAQPANRPHRLAQKSWARKSHRLRDVRLHHQPSNSLAPCPHNIDGSWPSALDPPARVLRLRLTMTISTSTVGDASCGAVESRGWWECGILAQANAEAIYNHQPRNRGLPPSASFSVPSSCSNASNSPVLWFPSSKTP